MKEYQAQGALSVYDAGSTLYLNLDEALSTDAYLKIFNVAAKT